MSSLGRPLIPCLAILLFTHCSSEESGSSGAAGYCLVSAAGETGMITSCVEYAALDDDQKESASSACKDGAQSMWVEDKSCPSANRIGHCTIESGGMTSKTYEYEPTLPGNAQSNCEQTSPKGSWSTL